MMYLEDVTVTHNDDESARVEYRGIVCTVDRNEARRAAIGRAVTLGLCAVGAEAKEEARRALEVAESHDAWQYTLPPSLAQYYGGQPGHSVTFSHPSHRGALHMCRKAFVEAGVILVPHDDSHLDERDRGIAFDLRAAWAQHSGPRVGDFVRLPGGRVRRICGIGYDGKAFALTDGGSFNAGGMRADPRGCALSYSGGLDWQDGQTLDRLHDSGETGKGRAWFFSHGYPGAGRGVDIAIDCRIFDLRGDA